MKERAMFIIDRSKITFAVYCCLLNFEEELTLKQLILSN